MKKLKNLLELPNPTRNTRKFANNVMPVTSGEINLQSKQNIICHVAKVKPATSADTQTLNLSRNVSKFYARQVVNDYRAAKPKFVA